MEMFGLFPIPVGKYVFDRDLNQEELDFIINVEKKSNQLNLISNDFYILDNKPLKDIKTFFQKSVMDYIQKVHNPCYKIRCKFTQSWINFCESKQGHHYHTHPNSFISGVFYVKSDKSASIQFHNVNPILLEIATKEHTPFTVGVRPFDSEEKVLYLFPSYLPHSVPTNTSEQTRISISFNTFITGTIGEKRGLTELEL
jgi:hypothetical protein